MVQTNKEKKSQILHNLITLCLVILIFALAVLVHPSPAMEALSITVTVNQNNSIQEAINNAREGATIYIEPGSYKEYQIIVNKTLTIIGKDREKTIINGDQEAEATALFSVIANHVTIKNLTLINTRLNIGRAIILKNVKNVTIENCVIKQHYIGIEINNSSDSQIIRNQIANNTYGIKILIGKSNVVAYNDLEGNIKGVSIESNAKNNLFFNNNFKNDQNREGFGVIFNKWNSDYIIGGNYWNDYEGEDRNHGPAQDQAGSDGIGDRPYSSDSSEDAYPYVNKLKHFYVGTWESKVFYVTVSTNASNIMSITFDADQKTICFIIEQNTTTYLRVIIPRMLLDAEEHEWDIIADQQNITSLKFSNSNFTCFYLLIYGKNVNQVIIKGATAIPEFQLNIILPMLAVTITAILASKKLNRVPKAVEQYSTTLKNTRNTYFIER
ncbi:MAG: NosD domain-containing protein [Candidatus Bathyarchaeia archaeon]